MKLVPFRRRSYDVNYLREIGSVPLFVACSRDDIRRIARWAERVTLPAGRVLAARGQNKSEFLVLLSGEALIQYPLGRSEIIGPGDYVGDVDILARAPRSSTVRAATDIDVLAFERRHFLALLDSSPSILLKVATDLAKRLWMELGLQGAPDVRADWARN
jgi:CRP-like cAMP-binding protein